MAGNKRTENAKGLYLEGIRDSNVRDALEKFVGDRYTQHSTGVADGKEGTAEFFAPLLGRKPIRDIQIVRAIEDGRYVFCHVYQSLNNGNAPWVTADLFDTDSNGKLVEHWGVTAEYKWPTASGRSMVDGSTDVEDLDKTNENKAIVQGFVDDVLIGGKVDKVTDYISTEQYDQHNPDVKDGLAGLGEHLTKVMDGGQAAQYVKVHHLIGQGNFAVIYSHVKQGDSDWSFFDIFRLKDGKIVEHWDVREKISPKET